eukprot:CAMPEP_0119097994 /NCGR_PEP_ID=MMETSP1178-20130426/183653_1 /TAXON_ID=33656 /ORGANISM="unid sp, Strain CCMP2000" /LENGTH=83 /DNA_ID=CAMNT_0007081959 /DNA_START=117 /DNA_END=365 /DNA_ORIENTATION=+
MRVSAKQEGAHFRRARKLGQRHQLVHHLLQQLAPRRYNTLGACPAARVPPLDEQPPAPSVDRKQPPRRAAAERAALFVLFEQR